jgi:predicted nuclease with TOPRIM domain
MYAAIFFILFIVSASLAGLFVVLFITKKKEFDEYFEEFKDVIDVDKETKKYQKEFNELKSSYTQKRSIYENLIEEISLLEEQTEDLSYGLYEPHFDFDTSERYKIEIQNIRNRQKEMIHAKNAAICTTEWTVSGSKSEGTKMTNRTIKLMLRAFNNECDAAVLKVRWNNVQKMRERITKAYGVSRETPGRKRRTTQNQGRDERRGKS